MKIKVIEIPDDDPTDEEIFEEMIAILLEKEHIREAAEYQAGNVWRSVESTFENKVEWYDQFDKRRMMLMLSKILSSAIFERH